MRLSHVLLLLLAAAVGGLSLFGVLVWRATTVERAAGREAERQFAAARAPFGSELPLLQRDASGRLTPSTGTSATGTRHPKRLCVLAYRVREQRVVRTNIPFWFFRIKGPAVEFALRDTGLDLRSLGITTGDLEAHGPGIVIDEKRSSGDRVLVWTE